MNGMRKLKDPRHELFCQNRVVGQTIDEAYTNAGFKPNRGNAARLNAKESIQARIGELMDDALSKTTKTLEDGVHELQKLAFSSLGKFYKLGEDGLPEISFENVDADDAAALADLVVDDVTVGAKTVRRVRIKLADKAGALAKFIDLKTKQRDREEERAALEAKTINGTLSGDYEDDYLKDLGSRFALKSLEDARAMKAGLLSPSGNGRAAATGAPDCRPDARSADDEHSRYPKPTPERR